MSSLPPLLETDAPKIRSYDNSGHRLSFPEWQSNSTNIARTNAVRTTLVATFVNDQDVVTSIQPLNECV